MQPFHRHAGIAAFLDRDDVDTDVIMPLGRLMSAPRGGLGRYAFEPLRYDADGRERPDFPLTGVDATILVAGRNFGSGSSREGAVYGIAELGIRVILAESFGDIFASNCAKNGLLAIALPAPDHERVRAVVQAHPAPRLEVDLERERITGPDGLAVAFTIDRAIRARLLDGRDDIAITLELEDQIAAFQARDRDERPWVWARRPVHPPHQEP